MLLRAKKTNTTIRQCPLIPRSMKAVQMEPGRLGLWWKGCVKQMSFQVWSKGRGSDRQLHCRIAQQQHVWVTLIFDLACWTLKSGLTPSST